MIPMITHVPDRRLALVALVGICVALVGGCSSPPLVPYSLDVPPLILVPVTKSSVTDGRGRFREIYAAIRDERGVALPDDRSVDDALHQLADEPDPTGRAVDLGHSRGRLRFVLIPGLFGSCVKDSLSPFPYARAHIEQFGYRTDAIFVSGRSSSGHNGTEIRDALLAMDVEPGERIVLVGYSKGAVDALHAVVDHPEVRERVVAVVSIAGAIGGSPLADEVEGTLDELIKKIHVPGCPPGDGGAVDSLRTATRQKWLAQNDLPMGVRYYSLGAFADRKGISSFLQSNYDKLARIDPRNDSQVLFMDAIIPGSTLLGFANADHWGLALAFSRDMPLVAASMLDRAAYPREVLLEAIARFVEEDLRQSPVP
jgi:pimeloyl-ACP methyl ester carboxylesterase